MAALNVPPKGDTFRRENAHFANLKVTAQYTPAMTVKVSAGGFWNDDTTYVEVNGGTSPTLTAPGAAAKLTVVALNLSGAIVLIDGAQASSPSLPAIPADRIPLAVVLLNSTDTSITNDMIFDLRPVFKIGADVNQLTVSSIGGLSSTLDTFALATSLTNGLATKADLGGTASSVFALNANHTGVPTADGSFRVERGSSPDVELRWNETSEKWEFTNDGTTFFEIPASASVGANASAIVVLQASVAQNSSRLDVLESASTHPLNLTAFRSGTTASASLFWIWPVATSTTIPTQSALGTALAGTAGAGSATNISIKHSASVGAVGSVIGTVKFPAAASAEGIVDVSTLAVVAPGEYLWASVLDDDATLADIAFTIRATKTTN